VAGAPCHAHQRVFLGDHGGGCGQEFGGDVAGGPGGGCGGLGGRAGPIDVWRWMPGSADRMGLWPDSKLSHDAVCICSGLVGRSANPTFLAQLKINGMAEPAHCSPERFARLSHDGHPYRWSSRIARSDCSGRHLKWRCALSASASRLNRYCGGRSPDDRRFDWRDEPAFQLFELSRDRHPYGGRCGRFSSCRLREL
jgi:hypothetical protein